MVLKAQSREDYTHLIYQKGNVKLVSHHPNFNPFAMASDRIWFDGTSIKAPRVVFHVGYALLNDGIDHSLAAIHTPKLIREGIVNFGLPLTPHLIQAYQGLRHGGTYELNLWDWGYDYEWKKPFHLGSLKKKELIKRAVVSTLWGGFARP